ncbi:F0F1 ATP synthase subunit delta [Thiohalobacter sp. IOR34]|uniref:F0F1 ATP synthase subunit delta n=1 Tax=Thiohalobacter sp. IOR34 TaxID=3057176 RepID=UPI0025B01227|nr:F0F1 ATP synthase subunit delta [Thiohalobacter sp. IOR34]WJW75493.1 F0F1 ATP synthase subunit delta [Thiohalobacter sp. IOR34]
MAEITTIARPYAQAAFKLAQQEQALDRWAQMLALAAQVAADEEMNRLLDDPRLTAEQIAGLFIDVCDDALDEHGRNLIRLLAENRRLGVFGEIHRLFLLLKSEAEGVLQAELISARPVSEQQKAAVLGALKARFGRDVELDCKVDESLIGGAVIRAGDLVIDGSVRGKLARLATALSH